MNHQQRTYDVFQNFGRELKGPSTVGGLLKAIDRQEKEGDTGVLRGVDLLVDDKIVSVLYTEVFDMTIWVEDAQDVCLQIYPPNRYLDFPDAKHFFGQVIEEPFKRVFRDNCAGHKRISGVSADYYLARDSHRMGLVHEPKRTGMDLLTVRFPNFATHYDWQDRIVDLLKELRRHVIDHYHAQEADG